MNKNNKNNNNYNSHLIKKIKNYINNSIHSDKFNHYKQKHSLDKLLDSLLIILLKGIPYRDIYKFTKIPWQTIYKFKTKLLNLNLFEILFSNIIDNYVKEIKKPSNIFNNESPIILNSYFTNS